MSNNTLTLVGRVGQKPRQRTTTNGKTVVSFSLGVKEYSPDGNDQTMWIDVELWNGLGDRAMKVITKGREISVSGRLHIGTYERALGDDTVKMKQPVIRARDFHLCGPRPASADKPDIQPEATEPPTEAPEPSESAEPSKPAA